LKDNLSILNRERVNLYIFKGDASLYRSVKSGIAPLIEAVEKLGTAELSGSTVVDKVVGKAAALIISYFQARGVYTHLISRSATKVLDKNRIAFYFERLTDEIKSRNGLGICPFESAVKEIDEPKVGYEKLRKLLREKMVSRLKG